MVTTDTQFTEETDSRPMADIMEELAWHRANRAKAQEHLNTITACEDHCRRELETRMQSEGIRTGEAHGLRAQLKTRKSGVVTDVEALTTSLREAGVLDDYLVLNKTAAAKEAVKNGWDGAEVQETAYVSISEVK